MTLFSDPCSQYSHRVRIVLAEKGVTVDIEDIDPNNVTQEILEANPYGTLPTLVDRDLALYESKVVMEYLDERFPHPPLLPVYPVSRANSRTLMLRINKEWCPLVDKLIANELSQKELLIVKEELLNEISTVAPTFKEFEFFMSEDFGLVDCSLAPLLWRTRCLGLEINENKEIIESYSDRIFNRESFQASLTETEKDM